MKGDTIQNDEKEIMLDGNNKQLFIASTHVTSGST